MTVRRFILGLFIFAFGIACSISLIRSVPLIDRGFPFWLEAAIAVITIILTIGALMICGFGLYVIIYAAVLDALKGEE